MDTTNTIFENLKESRTNTLSFDITNLFKLPLIVVLFGNVLYAFILLLRIRILADTFESNNNSKIKTLVYTYLFIVIAGSLVSLLFIILG